MSKKSWQGIFSILSTILLIITAANFGIWATVLFILSVVTTMCYLMLDEQWLSKDKLKEFKDRQPNGEGTTLIK